RAIKSRHSRIHGVVHSAIAKLDRSISAMTTEYFAEVLAVKTAGAVRMVDVFGGEKLDFILFFSSINTFLKSHGKAGYSAGCNFQDALAIHLGSTETCRVRTMDWGYWGEIGVGSEIPDAMKI